MTPYDAELLNEHELKNSEIALKKLLIKLQDNNYKWFAIYPINEGRYYIVKGTENIMVLFKREVFFNFGEMFKHEGMKGVGDSINVHDLQIAIQKDVKTIYSIFPDEKMYFIPLQEFLEKSFKWKNKEGKDVRSISIHEYKRLAEKIYEND